jgi:hypothetical protein
MMSKSYTIFGRSLLGTKLNRKPSHILFYASSHPLRTKSIKIKALAAEAASLFPPVYTIRHYIETPLLSSHNYLN